jgi:hypothetical protein
MHDTTTAQQNRSLKTHCCKIQNSNLKKNYFANENSTSHHITTNLQVLLNARKTSSKQEG